MLIMSDFDDDFGGVDVDDDDFGGVDVDDDDDFGGVDVDDEDVTMSSELRFVQTPTLMRTTKKKRHFSSYLIFLSLSLSFIRSSFFSFFFLFSSGKVSHKRRAKLFLRV